MNVCANVEVHAIFLIQIPVFSAHVEQLFTFKEKEE
uniref:Uncharacterized protein n=1 Tax=Arundo donax TaxID=35708 RepID=A0A0A9BUQ7_ARUDO